MDPDCEDCVMSPSANQLTASFALPYSNAFKLLLADGESRDDSWWCKQELAGVEVRLLDQDTWRQFSEVGTEMIVTKPGRRIFPELKVCLSGLEAGEQYVVALGVRLSCGQRFRFHKGRWAAWGRADPPRRAPARNLFLHADAPADGRHWSRGAVSLYAAKLTNDPASSAPLGAQILVSSMHKYVPVVHIFKTSSLLNLETCQKASFSFPEAEFIAVTAYQNDDLAALKIRNNPFAKAFRNKLTRRQSNADVTEISSVESKEKNTGI
ncbi:T-box transcription factor mls-1-like [Schistocerca cancellata]|uniref:T-box transcription factor mls-1-like n=1 Tax=Schistocerca cancellata TaxID=274614 RepID=UPI0021192209|nr:T-box transcription factor mls-1-like [Schistocerca cancellata]